MRDLAAARKRPARPASLVERFRSRVKSARKRGAAWVRLFDILRPLASRQGWAVTWTRILHRGEIHQTTPYTCEDRYPELFDLAAKHAPKAERILSFGCSTGEELVALRRRFPSAEIVGAEINRRSRRIAARRVAADRTSRVVGPREIHGCFDAIFALAVLQRLPSTVVELGMEDLSDLYPFERFDRAVGDLVASLNSGGLLVVTNAHYRIEDSSSGPKLEAIENSPAMPEPLFGPDGRLLDRPLARTVFRKR